MMDKPTGRILIVDDEMQILKSLQRVLIPSGHEVFTAESGRQGLDILAHNEVDIVISDMRMPEMDGAAFLKQVAEDYPLINRVLLTGYAELDSAVRAINEGGIDYYLSKPWDEEDLEDKITHLLTVRELREKNEQLTAIVEKQNEELRTINDQLEKKVAVRTEQLNASYEASIEVLSNVIDLRGRHTQEHCRVVARTAKQIAQRLHLSSEEIEVVYCAGLLYPIGMLGIKREILSTPTDTLAPAQLAEYQEYPALGELALMGHPALKGIAEIILTHREYLDGSGYPQKLSGDNIPIGSQILSVVIDYYEMQRGVRFEEALLAPQALNYLVKNVGRLYEKTIVECAQDLIASDPELQEKLSEEILDANNLHEGMRLSRDLCSEYGLLLLPKGTALESSHIAKLQKLKLSAIYIYPDK